jgi:hypothetical protein
MQRSPAMRGFLFMIHQRDSSDLRYVRGLWSLLSLYNFEFYLVAFGERLEARSADSAEVHKHIGPSLTRNKSKPLGVVEPFDRTSDACH